MKITNQWRQSGPCTTLSAYIRATLCDKNSLPDQNTLTKSANGDGVGCLWHVSNDVDRKTTFNGDIKDPKSALIGVILPVDDQTKSVEVLRRREDEIQSIMQRTLRKTKREVMQKKRVAKFRERLVKKRKAMLLMETELKRAEIEKRLSRKRTLHFELCLRR